MTEITNYIANDYKALKSNDFLLEVQGFFEESNFSHFPVLEQDVFVGNMSANEVENFDSEKQISDYKFSLESFFVRENMILLDVLEVFAKNNTTIVPVLDAENNYKGYYEADSMIKNFYETPFLREQGGIIVLRKGTLDYSMSQITQIVESNNGKILGIFVSDANAYKVEITLKINLGEMNEILQSFRRYDYEIISDHQDDDYLDILKERSEYLDKYLSI
jgi:CBS domain-containing protein